MIPRTRFYLALLIPLLAWVYMTLHADMAVPPTRPLAEFPAVLSDWRTIGQSTFSQSILDVLRPTDYLFRRYADPAGDRVDLYIGYHGGGEGTGGIHSPKHCLPGSGWLELSSDVIAVQVAPDRSIQVVRAVYQHGEDKEMFFYWFDVRGQTLVNEYALKIAETLGSALQRRRDAGFVRISVPFEADQARAAGLGARFIRDIYPSIREFLPS